MPPEPSTSEAAGDRTDEKLHKSLGLFDVFAVATGAMFSSGFFLLPGIAAAQTGPSVVLAFLISGVLVLPAALSAAELATAMPRAGGAYFFLDRTLGPLMGTTGGIGTWVALVLKTSFALVGMGAYLAIFIDLPIKPVALALIVAFTVLNLLGAKETTGLQRFLVGMLLAVLGYFIIQGLWSAAELPSGELQDRFSPLLMFGLTGLFSTVGLVFVSYAGLTHVASIAEEVREPDRNVPLGMFLALGVTLAVYVLGVFVMVAALDPVEFQSDLTPVATAGEAFFEWLPEPTGLIMVVAAAIAAFASTGNAGLMSASRYPLAMARDELIPKKFAHVSSRKIPTLSVLTTSGVMAVAVILLDVAALAKLASAMQLILFGLLCLAVLIMRESELDYYSPGFRSPLYPWVQIAGMIIPVWLIIEMGLMPVVFTLGVSALALIWYFAFARRRVRRGGALYHVFKRLGHQADDGLHHELRQVVAEKGLSEEDPFEALVTNALFMDIEEDVSFRTVVDRASRALSEQTPIGHQELNASFLEELELGLMPVANGAAVPHLRTDTFKQFHLALIRIRRGVRLPGQARAWARPRLYGVICLVGPEAQTGAHLRLLAQLASRIDDPNFLRDWLDAPDETALKTLLLRSDRFFQVHVDDNGPTQQLLDQRVRDIDLPDGALLALVRRQHSTKVPTSYTKVRRGDHLVFIGNVEAIDELETRMRG